jgi:hypothetical protein
MKSVAVVLDITDWAYVILRVGIFTRLSIDFSELRQEPRLSFGARRRPSQVETCRLAW